MSLLPLLFGGICEDPILLRYLLEFSGGAAVLAFPFQVVLGSPYFLEIILNGRFHLVSLTSTVISRTPSISSEFSSLVMLFLYKPFILVNPEIKFPLQSFQRISFSFSLFILLFYYSVLL